VSFLRLCVAVLTFASCVSASFAQSLFESKAEEAILVDANSGIVFYEKNADKLIEPASMSKLMTMILVFEALKKGDLTLDTELPITEDAWRRGGSPSGGSTMYAELNSRVKVSDLMRGAMIQSANDACITFAEALAGTEEAFAARMTERGKELGLKEAIFRNSTGLPDPQHLMSVRDLTLLARYIIQNFPDYYKFYSEREFTWNKITQQNRNPLLVDYPGADGMKTGYTRSAGYGLVGSVQRDGRRLLIVVAGLKSINERKQEAQKLLDYGFRQFKTVDVYAAGETVSKARVWGGVDSWIDLKTPNAVRLALSPAEQARVEVKINYKGPILAPVAAGTEVGKVKFMLDGKVFAETPVQTANSVEESPSIWSRALDSIMVLTLGG
jgi:serine-type D-Ala-D-Ala carboxypeptidase (penicillin-binding protein 5/6)